MNLNLYLKSIHINRFLYHFCFVLFYAVIVTVIFDRNHNPTVLEYLKELKND